MVNLNSAFFITTPTVLSGILRAEVPTGTVNSSNVTFTLSAAPAPDSLGLFRNGLLQYPSVDYTITANTITFASAPLTGSALWAAFTEPQASSGGGYDDWQNMRAIVTVLTAQLSATRMGFADGWIDSFLDTSGLNLTNSVGTFWAGNASGTAGDVATPTMTTNTAPSGVASASAEFSATYESWKAFNRTNSGSGDSWLSGMRAVLGSPATWQWLKYQFTSPRTITSYYITTRDYSDPTWPLNWILQGSNNNTDWTDLDTRTGQSWTGQNTTQEFTVTSPGSYSYYRLYIKDVAGTSYTAIGELGLRTTASPVTVESLAVTTPADAATYLVEMSVSSGATMAVQIDTGDGNGWRTVDMTRTVVSATVDQLSGTISASGTSTKIKAVADASSRVAYGWSLFWK